MADVVFDLFTTSRADEVAKWEIMIWLGRLNGAFPLRRTSGVAEDSPTINNITWGV